MHSLELLPGAEALFERAPCGLVVTQEDGTILRSNQTFAEWIGHQAQSLIGQRFQNLLTMGGRIFHQTHWAPLMRMQGSVAEVKLDLLHRDGRLLTLLLNGIRREHEQGVCYELALFGLVERDRYERELLAARKRAEQLLAERSSAELALQQAKAELAVAYRQAQRRASFAEQMVAIASHDLKNPLTAIKMASGLLARGERSAREQQLVDNIQVSCERAQRMIADLLDLASVRIGHGISIRRRPVILHDLVADSVAEWRVAFPQAHVRYLGRNRGTVILDPDRLYQALGNLVANGATYGDLRHPITLTSDVSAAFTTFTVHNHGSAIPAPVIPRLFEPMTRASERSAGVRSVGLGLFIVKEIVNAHGGEITVDSSEAAGTTFTLRLPALPSTAPSEALAP
ncbi:PAS domain-containing sensor histidine kinase [Pseudomonas cremoricolorata]|uniref:PAS domain-containing sensor histidine kinase n=1 Tax=Pseudomonas cremoricolorata TaxID=157783 RepID=UPI0004288766|nr:PAS domain-containing sensor histidine kinase [Pseudomonas cremoricolorata]